jgi:SHS2 domain-containing protein
MAKFDIEFLDHTADIGIKIFAPSMEQLFLTAAEGMFEIIIPNRKVNSVKEINVKVDALDREELIISWLSELNFLFQTRLFLPNTISIQNISDTFLSATVFGEQIDLIRHPVETEIKAVTFHKLYVHQQKDKWTAQIIFDI